MMLGRLIGMDVVTSGWIGSLSEFKVGHNGFKTWILLEFWGGTSYTTSWRGLGCTIGWFSFATFGPVTCIDLLLRIMGLVPFP
jgi:hypothetical protein